MALCLILASISYIHYMFRIVYLAIAFLIFVDLSSRS
jgi:hypothetical protein